MQEKVKYPIKTISKFSMDTANLNELLDSQYCVFNKTNIGFQDGFKKKVKKPKAFLTIVEAQLHHLFLASIAWKETILLDTVELDYMIFQKAL